MVLPFLIKCYLFYFSETSSGHHLFLFSFSPISFLFTSSCPPLTVGSTNTSSPNSGRNQGSFSLQINTEGRLFSKYSKYIIKRLRIKRPYRLSGLQAQRTSFSPWNTSCSFTHKCFYTAWIILSPTLSNFNQTNTYTTFSRIKPWVLLLSFSSYMFTASSYRGTYHILFHSPISLDLPSARLKDPCRQELGLFVNTWHMVDI